jgi:hypothetical protein
MRHFFYIVCLMSERDYLGEFEHIVVLALLRLAGQAYGVTVRQEIEVRIGREVSIGAIYATLARLETKATSILTWATRRPSAEEGRNAFSVSLQRGWQP